MSTTLDSKSDPAKVEAYGDIDHVADLDEKASPASYKADAIEAEQAEHNMGVIEAVKAYPMASLWAFIMSTTIVSHFSYLKSITHKCDDR